MNNSVSTPSCKPNLRVGTSAPQLEKLNAMGVIGSRVAGAKWQLSITKDKVGAVALMGSRVTPPSE